MTSRQRIQKKAGYKKEKTGPPKGHQLFQFRPFKTELKDDTPLSEVVSGPATFDFAKVGVVQPKLTIGEPNDSFEQEADRVAHDVVQRINSGDIGEQEETEQRSSISQVGSMPVQRDGGIVSGEASSQFESQLNQSRGGGSPLDSKLRGKLESGMGADFSGVRIHTNSQADQLNRSIQAKAFTTGKDVFFKQGEYNPNTQSGQELITHELTHVVQQSGGGTAIQRTLDIVSSRLPQGAAWSDFTSYALSEYNQEGPSFLQAAAVFRKMGRATTVAAAQKIHDKYIPPGSPKEINISGRVRTQTMQTMADSVTAGVPDLFMFDEAENEITSLCGDIMLRFNNWWDEQNH